MPQAFQLGCPLNPSRRKKHGGAYLDARLPHRGVLRVAIPNHFYSKNSFRCERRGAMRVLTEAKHPANPCVLNAPRAGAGLFF
jgi:hypothetical protein